MLHSPFIFPISSPDEVSITLEDVNKRMEEVEGRMEGIVKMIEDLKAELNQDESSKGKPQICYSFLT